MTDLPDDLDELEWLATVQSRIHSAHEEMLLIHHMLQTRHAHEAHPGWVDLVEEVLPPLNSLWCGVFDGDPPSS